MGLHRRGVACAALTMGMALMALSLPACTRQSGHHEFKVRWVNSISGRTLFGARQGSWCI